MAVTTVRRTVAKVVAGALTVAALGVGQLALGNGVAAAAGAPAEQTVKTSNITATKKIEPAVAYPGDVVTTTITVKASGVDRYMQDLTDYPPAGYELQSVTSTAWRSGPVLGGTNDGGQYDGTPTQDPNTGAVRVNWKGQGDCAGAACKLVLLNKSDATITFKYKVPNTIQTGPRTTGMAFNIYAFNSEQKWNPLSGLNVGVLGYAQDTITTVTAFPVATKGEATQLTASVLPNNATGTVQFKENGTAIGAPIQVANGAATLQHTFSTAGNRQISAVFTGTGGFANSTSAAKLVTVGEPGGPKLPTQMIMTSPSNAKVGDTATLSAKIDGAPAYPGTVQFFDNGSPVGDAVTVTETGEVVLLHVFSTAGPHNVNAVYSGDAGVGGSVASEQTISVAHADPEPEPEGSAGSLGIDLPFGS